LCTFNQSSRAFPADGIARHENRESGLLILYFEKKLPPALPQAGDESLCDFASLVSEIESDFTARLKIGLFKTIHPKINGGEIAFVALVLWK